MTLPSTSTPFIEVPAPTRRRLRGGLFDTIGPAAVHDLPRLAGHGVGVAYLSVNCNRPIGVLPAPCNTDDPPVITAIECTTDPETPLALASRQGPPGIADVLGSEISCDCADYISYGAPFVLYGSACVNPLEDDTVIQRRARDSLTAGVGRAVERIFATILPRLAADITPQACQYGIAGALAALEGQMASTYDGSGIIHAPAFAASYLANGSVVTGENGNLETLLGTGLALGGGYSGDGPDGEAATDCTCWMYITPQVDIWRGNLSVPFVQATDHNTTMAVAQQPYALTIDCGGVYGVRVNVDPCNCP